MAPTTRRRSRLGVRAPTNGSRPTAATRHNNSAATACNDPNEQATIATQLVQASCVPSPVVLRGLAAKVRTSLSVHVTALGVKSVTFYLDGRKLKTVTKAKNERYSIKVSARGLGYGRHRLQVRVQMRNATCATAAARRRSSRSRRRPSGGRSSPVSRYEGFRCPGWAPEPRARSRSASASALWPSGRAPVSRVLTLPRRGRRRCPGRSCSPTAVRSRAGPIRRRPRSFARPPRARPMPWAGCTS